MSIRAALNNGLLSHNAQVSTISGAPVSKTYPNPSVGHLITAGLLDPSLPASALGFSGQYGGD